ncbi:MAG TPA: acyl-CoA dehydrogenase family protein [Pseudonocardia sp.]|jgi:alkylation response protein AidB-like acyl-CoA dehydrogenase|nr:acyl-CoA dehydrogenase family protein [Pseudonocardia sp.]
MTTLDRAAAGTADTDTDLVARAHALRPLLAAQAAQGERDGRLTEPALRALTEAGLFLLGTPARYGGHQSGARTLLDVGAAVSEADGSTGWVLTLGNACAWVAGLFPERAQDEVFGADPLARVSGALAPTAQAERAGGGYRVSGRWAYNSGLWHADWTLLGIPLDGGGSAADGGGMALVPAADYRVEQTWTHVGMRATGSNSVVAEDIFVPDHRVVPLAATIDGVSVFAPLLTLILAAPQLGMGRAAVRLVREAAAGKPVTGTGYQRQADSVAFQLQLAEAALKVDTAELHSHRAAADIDSALATGLPLDRLRRARVRADTGLAVQSVVDAIGLLVSAHGAASFASDHPLQRIWRDANVAMRHAMALPAVNYEIYGKALLGVEPNISPMI